MQKSRIEWAEFTANPVKGKCPVDCSYCYVKPMRKRFGWADELTFHASELSAIQRRKKPARIFVGSTMELFHDSTMHCMPAILETVKACPQHTFMFLTKRPQNLAQFSPFPDNCYVGISITNYDMAEPAVCAFAEIDAKVKFVSYEPLLEQVPCGHVMKLVDWIIIGAQTNPARFPRREWVERIEAGADKAGIPVFEKNNIKPLLGRNLRQEMP